MLPWLQGRAAGGALSMRGAFLRLQRPCPHFACRCLAAPLFALPAPRRRSRPSRKLAETDAYPTKAIRIIVPFAPGGSGDITARLIGKYIEDKTGQPFVVENKPGANGIVGVLAVKAARGRRLHPDAGHHLDQRRQHPHVQEPGLRPGEGFHGGGRHRLERRLPRGAGRQPLQDARPTCSPTPRPIRASSTSAISMRARRCRPRCWAPSAGVEWQGVAYKAIGNAWTDLYAGAIQFMFVDLTAGRGQVVANKARPLAITLPERSPLYPDAADAQPRPSPASPAPASSPSPCPRPRRGRSRRS